MKEKGVIYNKRLFLRFIFSVLASLALSLDIGIPDLHMVPKIERDILIGMPEIIWNFYGSLHLKAFPVLAVSIFAFFSLIDKKYEHFQELSLAERVLFALFSLFLAITFVVSEAFCMSDSLAVLYSSLGQLLKTLVSFAGLFWFYYQLISCFYLFLDKQDYKGIKKNKFWKRFLMILVAWMPYIIFLYPGAITADAYNQLNQFFGFSGWSSHHPPFSTIVMGIIFSIGKVFGGNFAIFLYCLVQTVVFALILAYMIGLFAELETPKWLYLLTMFCIITVPYYTNYIMVVLKDGMYSYCFLLFVVELIYMSIKGFEYFKSKRHIILWLLSVTGIILMRNNGKFVVYPIVAILCFYLIYKIIRNGVGIKKNICDVVIVICPVIIASVFSCVLTLHFDIKKGSIAEALSLPLQQTARYVYYHQDEVTKDEEAVLRSVLDYDNLAKNYNPRVSDPVKATFKYNPSREVLLEYFRVWIAQGIKHPGTYIAAVMDQNYYLFYPLVPNNIVFVGLDGVSGFSDIGNGISFDGEFVDELNIHDISVLSIPQKILFLFYQAYFYVPIIGWFAHPAIYVICLIGLCLFAIVKKMKMWLFVSLPVLLSFAVVVLGPAIQRHPRYAFPIIYSVPLLLAYYIYCNKKLQIEKLEK